MPVKHVEVPRAAVLWGAGLSVACAAGFTWCFPARTQHANFQAGNGAGVAECDADADAAAPAAAPCVRVGTAVARDQAGDATLVLTLRAEITRQGGSAKVASLLTYCPAARPLLRDQRLLSFLRGHPEAFEVSQKVTSKSVLHTKAQKGKVFDNIEHIVRVLEPLSDDDATDNQAVAVATRQILQKSEVRSDRRLTFQLIQAVTVSCVQRRPT